MNQATLFVGLVVICLFFISFLEAGHLHGGHGGYGDSYGDDYGHSGYGHGYGHGYGYGTERLYLSNNILSFFFVDIYK
jgi:hypothetical protein